MTNRTTTGAQMKARGMNLSSVDVENAEFKTAKKHGYNRAEVGAFLAQVAATISALEDQVGALRRSSRECEDRLAAALRESEESSKSFLLAAELKQKLLADAEARARDILTAAHVAAASDDVDGAVESDLDDLLARIDPSEDPDDSPEHAGMPNETDGASPREEMAQLDLPTSAPEDARKAPDGKDAEDHDTRDALKVEAQKALDKATAALERARAEADSILKAAREEADHLTTQGASMADALIKTAERQAADLAAGAEADASQRLRDAAAESAKIIRAARLEADEMLERAQSQYQDTRARLTELDRRVTAIDESVRHDVSDSPTEPEDDELATLLEAAHELAEDVAGEMSVLDEPSTSLDTAKESRYARRSARLPSLGKDANRVLATLDSLRTSDSEGRTRRK